MILRNDNEAYSNSYLLNQLLDRIEKVDYRTLAGINDKESERLKLKHFLVSTIDKLLDLAIKYNWGLCRRNDFIYLYNGEYWNLVENDEFKEFLGNVAQKMGVDEFDAKYYNFQEQLFKQFLASAHLKMPNRDKNVILINLKNGTFEISLKGSFLREFRSEDFLTYQLPFEYILNANCLIFEQYLQRVLPDKALQKILAEYLGYIFTKQLKLEKCLLLYGTGANGKSVFFEVANALLGKENVSNFSLGHLGEEHNRGLIGNKLLNYGSELKGNIESDYFKQLTSGERIQCRMKYGNSFFIDDYARLCFNCNELPKDVEHNEAFFRRFLIIPFEVTIPEEERNPELALQIINNELSGVFNWVLEGLNRLLFQKGFTPSNVVKKAVEEYKLQSDSVHLFITEQGYKKTFDLPTPLGNIYNGYKAFCQDGGYKALSKINFSRRLKDKFGVSIERKNHGMVVFLSLGKEVVLNEKEILEMPF